MESGQTGQKLEKRETWGSKAEFLLSCIGYCVGLGNVWRFPYLAYENGGGVFFIPYFLMLFICGIPLFMAELALGQYSNSGAITVWKCLPAFKGIGYGMVIVSFLIMIYYNIIIAYSLHYLFSGFQKVLPWTKCDEWWNQATTKAECLISESLSADQLNCRNPNFWKNNETLVDQWKSYFNQSDFDLETISQVFNSSYKSENAQEYWFRRVLRLEGTETDSGDELWTMDNLGSVLWDLVGSNAAAWVLVFLCLCKGVQSSGKVVYFTATFPYVVLLILVIFGATLDGAKEGIEFYLKPDVSKLADGKVWADAATQIFYSLGVSSGGLMIMASYNKFENNIFRDTMVVCIGNCVSSVFAGFGVFSFLGHMAYRNCLEVKDVVKSGPGLAFIAYPEAISLLPVSQLFSALFFIMLVLLGIDSQFAMVDVLVASIVDKFPNTFRREDKPWYKTALLGFCCIIGFLLGLPMLTNGGYHLLNLVDGYAAYYGLLLLAFAFTIAVHYVYQFSTVRFRFIRDIEQMNGKMNKIAGWYLKSMWFVGSPVMLAFIIIFAFTKWTTVAESYVGSYGTDAYLIYPTWTTVIAMLMTFAPFAPIPIYFIYAFLTKRTAAFIPEDSWERSEGLGRIEPGIENYTYRGERATSFRRNGSYRQKVENNSEES